MLAIVWSLIIGWFLKLFGFNVVMTALMSQVFGVTINVYGYYGLFALYGMLIKIFHKPSIPLDINTRRNRDGF